MFALYDLSVIFFAILQVFSGQFVSAPTANNAGAFRQTSFISPCASPFSSPIASTSASTSSSFQTSHPSTIPSSLQVFISTFTHAVDTSPVLMKLFDVSQTSLQSFKNFSYQSIYALLKSMDVCNAHDLATYDSDPITDNFEYLPYPILALIHANSIGKQLLAERILNQCNAVWLAFAFANEMERRAKQTNQKNDPESKVRAILDGYVGFLKSQGLNQPENLEDAARHFGTEVILAGSRFGGGYKEPWTRQYPSPNCKTPQYVRIPQRNPGSGSIFANVPAVTLFTNSFHKTLDCTPILQEAFDFSQTTAKQYADYLTAYARDFLSNLDVENADAIAEWTSRAILLYFDVLTLPVVSRAFVNSAVHYLFVNGHLDTDNAENLGLAFAQAIADTAKFTMNADPTSKFAACCDGFANFLLSFGLDSKEGASLSAYYIGNEWFVAATSYKCW